MGCFPLAWDARPIRIILRRLLTSVSFTAVQYAIFSSLMTLFPKLLGGYSGSMVESMGYPGFFLLTTLLGLPVLVIVWRARQHLEVKNL